MHLELKGSLLGRSSSYYALPGLRGLLQLRESKVYQV